MITIIPNFLNLKDLNYCRKNLEKAEWIDGKATTGHQSVEIKHNLQLAEDDENALKLAEIIQSTAIQNPLFFSAALPKTFYPPMFNCYQNDGSFGQHIDNAIRKHPFKDEFIRTDLSCTVFISNHDEYEGGELIIEDTFGLQSIKLPAGHAVLYPATSLHKVNPVTQGARVASFFWVQSFIASDSKRQLLFNLDQNIQKLSLQLSNKNHQIIELTGIYHNLLREWSDL